ncbi:enhanced entry virulence factor RtxA [Legionella pneumophila]|uniref:enhanced entry virulence factor RtxA n=1 Tax=Legionella pneumophila TaxID=446 RepID=UPI000AFEE7D9|nr:enhanced entry virulence factor RtxA [Legionella pneumophila]
MLAESVIGIVRAVNGLLEKVNVQGQASLVKSGARLEEGDVLTLLSGEAYIQFIHGFPEALALEKPVKLDGVSPTLQYGAEDLKEQMVQEAIAKGIDPSVILDILGSAAAGAEAVGSGGDAFIMDPLFGFGHVTAGYPTGPISFAYEAETQQLFWFVPEQGDLVAESELTSESILQIPQFNTNQAVLTVFEDALPSGIPDSAGQAKTASSSLSTLLTSSPDVAASFAFNTNLSVLPTLKSGGIDLSYELSSDKRTLTLRESSTQGPGAEVMKFEMTADGQITQILIGAIDHRNAGSDWMIFDLSPLINVTFTRTSDGTVLESRTLPDNAVVAGIQDDVPIARAQLTNNEILLDETIGMKVGDADAANDDFNPTTTADPFNNTYGRPIGLVQNANLLDTSTSEMGADYKNATMTHLLKITDAVSGLQTTDGTPINLFLESNGDITGRAGDIGAPAVFAIRMNPNTGAISVAQYGPIKQFDTNSHDEAVDLTGRISAVVTAKDSDGDESNVEIPIGQLIVFEDDGPSIVVSGATQTLTVDESVLATNDTQSFAGLFTPSFGADGAAAANALTYSLGVSANGAASGVLDTASGNQVFLFLENGIVVGREGSDALDAATGDVVFNISVDGSGNVTLDQVRAVVHDTPLDPDESTGPTQLSAANLVTLTAVATDKDGDSASATANIGLSFNFEDDGPVAGTISLVADEDNLPIGNNDTASGDAAQSNLTGTLPVNFGADGAGSIDFQGMHGMSAVIGNDNITYNWNAGTNTLTAYRTGGTLGVNDVFKIVVNPTTGQYTFTLLAAINHHAVADNTEGLVDPFVNLNYRVIDGDGDTAIGTLKVTIDDDVPKAITPEEGFVTNQADIVRTFDLDFDANIDNNVGADQLGTIAFSGITNGQIVTGTVDGVPNQTLTSGGSAIHYYVSGNNVVEGWINGGPGDVGSTIVFRTTLQPDMDYNASNDTYKFELFQPISTSTNVSITDFSDTNATNREFIYLEDASSPGEDILFSAYRRNDNGSFTDATVNTNAQGIGVNNQNMNDRENLRVDFVRNASTTGTNQNMTYEYDDHYLVNNFSFKIVQVTGNPPTGSIEVWVRAYNADDDDPTDNTASSANNLAHQNALRDDPQVALTQILVNGVPVTPTVSNPSAGGYLISGLNLNDTITIRSANGYDRVEIENPRSGAHGVSNSSLNNETFDIGLFSYDTIKATPSEININMGLSLTDSDGDKINSSIEINLAPSIFKVGENVADTSNSDVPHTVGEDTGIIDGSSGADVLVGDIGGIDVSQTNYNLILILDTSGSMAEQIPFGDDGSIQRIQALKNSVNELIDNLAESNALNIRVHVVQFNTHASTVGTFNLIQNGSVQSTQVNNAHNGVNSLTAGGGTNYEAAFNQALNWVNNNGPLTANDPLNQVLFLSDGVPTYYYAGNGTTTLGGSGSSASFDTIFQPLGSSSSTSGSSIDNQSEVAQLEANFGQIQAVGINLNSNDIVYDPAGTANDLTAVQILDKMEGSNPSSLSNNITTAEQLTNVLAELSLLNQLNNVGGDVITGNEENDIIFGDTLNTDKLAVDSGLNLFNFPKGSGWAVFEELEANHGWSRQDTLDYIASHADELGKETVLPNGSTRSGGHDTISGGQGNDQIYGQEGNDIIDGGAGNDVIVGGTGNDTLTGGSGADQFVLFRGHGSNDPDTAPTDTIADFEANIDKIVINGIGINITGVTVSPPDVNNIYAITVNYSGGTAEHFKVKLDNSGSLSGSVVITGNTATIDGTIVGAVLYLDLNANNQEDAGERLGITNQYGHVEWVVDLSKFDVNGDGQYVIGEARAVQTGGFDIDTGLSYEINLYGPVGSAVISPLTSLLQAQLEAGMDYETANAALVARLGLPEGTQIISFNPITGSGEVLAQNAGVMTAAIQFAEIAAIHYSTDEGHVSFAVFEAISKALLELPEGVVADFGDEGFLQSISNYLGLDALVTSDMIDYMATSQKALEASILTLAPGEDALTAISKIQHVTQGIYAQAIEMALIGYLPLDALKNMSAVLKAYADGDITDEQLNSFEDKLSAVIVNWEDNNVTDTSHQATLQTERTVDDSSVKSEVNHEMAQEVNAVINDFMDEHNISLYYYDQQAQMPQEAQEQQPTEHQAEETVMHDDVVQDLLLDDHSLTMLANNPQLNGGNGNDVLHGTTGNDFIRGGQGNDTMTGGGGVDTFFWLSGDDDGGVDTITDFKANPVDQSSDASVLNLSDLLSDADLETNSLDNYLNVSTTEEGDTAIKVDPNGNGNFDAPAQTIILEDVDLTAVFATNNSHDIVNQMIANGNLIVEQ